MFFISPDLVIFIQLNTHTIMKNNKQSPRQELRLFVGRGDLRATLDRSANLSPQAMDLLVNIVLRYCESSYRPKKQKKS